MESVMNTYISYLKNNVFISFIKGIVNSTNAANLKIAFKQSIEKNKNHQEYLENDILSVSQYYLKESFHNRHEIFSTL